MTLLEVAILGAVQGLTEFLPVSSSGHLVIARMVFGIPDTEGGALDAFLHIGTLLALLWYYWRTWVDMGKALLKPQEHNKEIRLLAAKLVVATIPAAILGFLCKDYVETALRGEGMLVIGFTITAAVLLVSDILSRRRAADSQISYKDAGIIGFAQVVALVPSISRSGVTIAAGLARGLSRKEATTFSFLMSAPIIAGASLVSFGSLVTQHAFDWSVLLVGTAMSFLFGWVAIALLMRWIEKISLWPFVVYLLVLAGWLYF